MAKIEDGLLSGKLGGKVYCRHPKTPYVRNMPAKSTKEPTEEQVFRRHGFKLISAFIKPLADLLKLHFKGAWHNMGLKLNLSEALIQEGAEARIDYSKIRLTKRGTFKLTIQEAVLLKTGELLVDWEFSRRFVKGIYEAVILVYCPSRDLWCYCITDYCIDDYLGGIIVPDDLLGKELHGYIYFLDHRSGAASDTLYLGEFS
ncbi:DUF6266 family protein [Desertivirga xinjiangensis]|uniref:DUF6266 family protein n=1 Tax=Desertivirga xinjiangensis TaxID=539206 RepID=UPI00210B890B|nr:DUF6266 family protein [Pedobacter xinjiangensis]